MLKIELNVCLIPCDKVSNSLISYSQKFAKYPNEATVVLENSANSRLAIAPHLTLYQVPLLVRDLEGVADILAEIAAQQLTPLHLTATSLAANVDEGSLEVRYDRPDELVKLQCEVIHRLNPMRGSNLIEKDPAGNDLSLSRDAQVLATGFNESYEAFRPHVTLNWFHQGSKIDTETAVDLSNLFVETSGVYDKLGLFVLGPQGTCPQLLTHWDFAVTKAATN
jgi:hypothetical protein